MIKILLVDDSNLTLTILKKLLATAADFEVVGTANDGKEALALVPILNPDVICTDLKMPDMDGLALTQAVMENYPRPILVISSVVQSSDTSNIFNLIQAGAVDFIAKPRGGLNEVSELNARELIAKIRVLSGVRVLKRKTSVSAGNAATNHLPSPNLKSSVQVIGIGSSTGGPQALQKIFSHLPGDFHLPIVCVQHITEGFSDGLVKWLNNCSALKIVFAENGVRPKPGHVYIAPDNIQLEFSADKSLHCYSAPKVLGHRPSINVMLQSLALRFGEKGAGIILTGMGQDGVDGLLAIRQAGGTTIAQDENSCIVYGMPKVAIEKNAAQLIIALDQMAKTILRF
jgi:two-component system, chemotaxis family, protein-glutamate methylesterase/glutaminase